MQVLSAIPLPSLGLSDAQRRLLLLTLSCLEAVLYSTSAELLGRIGGTKAAKLLDLCIWYNPADDGFDGKCFENVVHVALRDGDGVISPFIRSVVEHFCGIKGEVTSIQFGPEREGTRPTVEPARRAISDEARVYFANGAIGPKLKTQIEYIAASFIKRKPHPQLDPSLLGLVKADLFVGSNAAGGFAAATLKMRQGLVQGGQGLALAIYPGSDRNRPIDPYLDNELNLVRVPLPYQNSFTEQFGFALRITRTFLESRNATTPPWTKLPGSDERAVCRQLEQRREESFVEAVNFLRAAASTPLPVISNSSPRMST